jgi:hypothetical protein
MDNFAFRMREFADFIMNSPYVVGAEESATENDIKYLDLTMLTDRSDVNRCFVVFPPDETIGKTLHICFDTLDCIDKHGLSDTEIMENIDKVFSAVPTSEDDPVAIGEELF